jgi:hypothetical protein
MSHPLWQSGRMDTQTTLPLEQKQQPQHIDFPLKPIATETMRDIQRARAFEPKSSMTGRKRMVLPRIW